MCAVGIATDMAALWWRQSKIDGKSKNQIGVQKCEEHESGTENDQQFKSTSRFEHVFVRLAQWTSSEHVSGYKIKNRQLSLLLLISPDSTVLIMLTLGTS